MSRRNHRNARIIGALTILALTSLGFAQESVDSRQQSSKHQYTLASLAGNYSVTGTFGSHAGGYVGTADIDSKGVISNDNGIVADPDLAAPLELSTNGGSAINADGTGVFTENVTVAGGASNVPYHFTFVIVEAHLRGKDLIATRIALVQQEPSPLPNGASFASFVYTRRPE